MTLPMPMLMLMCSFVSSFLSLPSPLSHMLFSSSYEQHSLLPSLRLSNLASQVTSSQGGETRE
ncbi:hypothetical protein M758_12G167200 [Ceratodon purpureus]|nr:hypothetical protein M758_12G167200 [Ceratodon purpureus]